MPLGTTPLDATTAIGKFRLISGDSTARVEAGAALGEYGYWSDAEIQAFLSISGDSIPRAIGYAIHQLANAYSAAGRSVSTDDLTLNTTGKGKDLLAVAKSYMAMADVEESKGVADVFMVAGPTTRIPTAPSRGTPYGNTPAGRSDLSESELYEGLFS